MYFIDVSGLNPEFKEDLLLRLSETYPCYHTTLFLDKDWWVFGDERLLFSDFGPDTNDMLLTWDEIDHYMALKELEGLEVVPRGYTMFLDAEEPEF